MRNGGRGRPLNSVVRPHVDSAPKPSVEILGAYQVALTDNLIAEAIRWKYPWFEDLSPEEQRATQAGVREEIGSAVLFEVAVRHRDNRFDVDHFQQPNSDQAPYDVAFLSPDGALVISRDFDVPEKGDLRAVFYLHFVNFAEPLITTYGAVEIPAVQPMPSRLAALVPYEPVT